MGTALVGRLLTHSSSDVGLAMVGISGTSLAESLRVPSASENERLQPEHEAAASGFGDWQSGQIIRVLPAIWITGSSLAAIVASPAAPVGAAPLR